ncbi:KpsF/GutQ family sugar-phosphate isomerase [Acidisoma cellulosilytica]|uniref:KpsF/GutQ family sugar-phosphate isomerase n=1 Tax=Acidisoma cellulosilyticum TaxID=2802395 RepID=A0A964E252_9PROT|nr:KpsF/GutQ family sugar-phosphate isomerase [Acidisoma cellulosilyticum]MCB8879046.1 KpsF/GutQ family sugar-phosphate isomerase [Acidisoma cellulosilyticum]
MTPYVTETVLRTIRTEMQGLAALEAALPHGLNESFADVASLIEQSGCVIVTGMGKSGLIGRKIAATLASTGTPSHFVHPAEASHGDLGMIAPNDVVLALSWSGETPELADIVAYTRRFGIKLVAMTSRADSALGRAADLKLLLPVAEEACPNGLAPTTSTTMQLVAGDALAILLLERSGFTAHDFQRYHPGGKLGARLLTVGALMHTGDQLPLVPGSATLSQGIVEMTSKRFGIAAVVDKAGHLVGALTDGDLRRAFRAGFVDMPVEQAMGRRPQIMAPGDLAALALARMNEMRITCIFVVEGDKPVGLVHIHDLLRAGVA